MPLSSTRTASVAYKITFTFHFSDTDLVYRNDRYYRPAPVWSDSQGQCKSSALFTFQFQGGGFSGLNYDSLVYRQVPEVQVVIYLRTRTNYYFSNEVPLF